MQNNNAEMVGQSAGAMPAGSFSELAASLRKVASYDPQAVASFSRTIGGYSGQNIYSNPFIQNNRVKNVSSLPKNFSKDKVSEMLTAPYENEQTLRQIAHALEYTSYPFFHIRKTYQALMTYHNYVAPKLTDEGDMASPEFWREWKLLEKVREALNPAELARGLAGKSIQEGKVFVTPRVEVDKSHNKVCHAFLQQLPSDWCKIVGFNNVSKYTIAFDMMYFTRMGNTPLQFGDLFAPYLDDFGQLLNNPVKRQKGVGSTTVFAQRTIDGEKYKRTSFGDGENAPKVYNQNGRWFYWVTLPVDRVFTFEADEVNTTAISPFAGLYINMVQLAQMEQIQLELIQNPLISLLTGEIPYRDDKVSSADDQYKMSTTMREFFITCWNILMQENNTSGIGFFPAPFQNMKLSTLSEAPSAMDIVHQGYADTMGQAGLSGLLPIADDPKAGISQMSLQIESRFMLAIYDGFERMMKAVIRSLNLKYDWAFKMFGSLATDKEEKERCMKGMEHGILPDTIIYNALLDRSILDDICWSHAVQESGINELRVPLVASYNQSQNGSESADKGGRPKGDGSITTDGSEGAIDTYGDTNPVE